MNSIFLRIYGGMTLVCLLMGVMFYLGLEGINYFRLQFYRNALLTGPIQFIAETVSAKPEADRQALLTALGSEMEIHFELQDPASLALTRRERQTLETGGVVLRWPGRSSVDSGTAIVPLQAPGDAQYLVASGQFLTQQIGRGLVDLVATHLTRYSVSDWDTVLVGLNERFLFPVTRIPPFKVDVNLDKKRRLFEANEPVAVVVSYGSSHTFLTAYKRLPQTGEVLKIGPQAMFNWYPFELLGVLVILALAVVGFAVYLLVKPLENRLSALEKAVLMIRGGDLNARAPEEGSDAIGQLAGTLNKMTEHIQRLLNAQKELTRAVSHELRTPVARIRFGLEMLMDAENDEQRLRNVELIDQDIEQLDKLIDEILTYSKLEEGTPVLDFVMIDLNALMKRIEQESQALSGDKQVIYISPNVPAERGFAEGEERYIHRVVQNLVGNALRYANSRVEITFSTMGDIFRIDVSDDGPGIPEHDRKRVFQPFTRLDDSRTRASGGYGLGLSIVNRIAYWHGGRVKVGESEIGGAKFSFLWPRLQSLRESN